MSLLLLVFLGFSRELLMQDKYFFLTSSFYEDLSVRKWKKEENIWQPYISCHDPICITILPA